MLKQKSSKKASIISIIITFLLVATIASPLLNQLQSVLNVNSELIQLTQLSTLVAAVVVWLVWRKRFPFPSVTKNGVIWPLLAVITLTAITYGVLLIMQVVGPSEWPVLDISTLTVPFIFIIVAQLVGALSEEVGWRGVVQPLLELKTSVLKAALLTGLLFGAGHFYVLSAGILIYSLFVVSAIGLSLALAATTSHRSAKERILISTIFHWLINMVFLLGFSGGDESLFWIANTAVATTVIGLLCVPFLLKSTDK